MDFGTDSCGGFQKWNFFSTCRISTDPSLTFNWYFPLFAKITKMTKNRYLKNHDFSRAPFCDQKTFFYFFAKDSADRTVENRRPKKNRLLRCAPQTIFFWPPIFDCSICCVFCKKIKKSFLIARFMGQCRLIVYVRISSDAKALRNAEISM